MSKLRSVFSAFIALGLAASGVAMAAQAGKGPPHPPRFENYRWIIASYFDGQSVINSHAPSSIIFRNGRIQGVGSCGAFGGEYFVSRGVVRIHAETVLGDGPCFDVNLMEAQAILD